MKKLLIIITILILSLIGGISFYYIRLQNNKPEYIKSKYKEMPGFENEKERQDFINQFASASEILEEENEDYPYNAGGIDTANIINIAELLDYIGVDGMVFAEEELTLSLEMLPRIKEDILDLSDSDLNRYLLEHQNMIIRQYGINDLESFKDFTQGLSYIKENEKISEGSIDINTIRKIGNSIFFELDVKTNKGNNNTYSIKIELAPSSEGTEYLIYWEMGM